MAKELFTEDGHYHGKPAKINSELVKRRINHVKEINGFIDKEKTLLDIGCGNGASMFYLSEFMRSCTGVDITKQHEDEFTLQMNRRKILNCSLKILDVVKETAVEKYDRIISFEVIEHLSDESGLKYYYDSLADDGIMAISVPNKWWPFETHGAKLPLLPWNRVPFFSYLPKPIHEKYANARIYTKKRIINLLQENGFKVLSYLYITTPLDVLPDGKIKKLLLKYIFKTPSTRFPVKAPSIMVVAKKMKNG